MTTILMMRDFIIKCCIWAITFFFVLKVLSNIDSIIRSPRAPPLIYRRSKGPVQNYVKENGQECGFEHLPLTIEMWADQLMALKVRNHHAWLYILPFIYWQPLSASLYVALFFCVCVAFVVVWLGIKWTAESFKNIHTTVKHNKVKNMQARCILLCILHKCFHSLAESLGPHVGFGVFVSGT